MSAQPQESIAPVSPRRDDGLPLYIQAAGTRIGKRRQQLVLKAPANSDQESRRVGLGRISQINIMGPVQITTQAMQSCLRNEIPVAFFSQKGWFYGRTVGIGQGSIHTRIAQFKALNSSRGLSMARVWVADKIANQRTILRRNGRDRDIDGLDEGLRYLRGAIDRAEKAECMESLRGVEGQAARRYWAAYSALLAGDQADPSPFAMDGRTTRPPEDRSNALLSYGYALLAKDCHLATAAQGLDPELGFLHEPRSGRPSLALDLMEPFRPLIVDSAVLQVVRRGEIKADDFEARDGGIYMASNARKALIQAYERRMDDLVTHPMLQQRLSYRRMLSVEARLMARHLNEELERMPSFRTR